MERKKNWFRVSLQADTGQTGDVEIGVYWDKNNPRTPHEAGVAAAVRAWWESGKRVNYAATKVVAIDGPALSPSPAPTPAPA